ncbi:hypothetical protein FisN_25Lh053 [Fistulifera solaris]|uniref:Uncharacterized protein n=1 Tax=Fistulifera solaris TaxID=1519565 RepID=A0A1Z5KAZ3_FISSO|nr:hypothetical protein FisN_25Lh053 [Fistulifera solaris]|eukprot:GAX23108.1 hypothetical protein FisN_25Lh053 [Fistulifera solaris]
MALLGGSVVKLGEASDHAANSNENEGFEEDINLANKLSETAERNASILQTDGNQIVDSSLLLVSDEASEPAALCIKSAPAFVQQLTLIDEKNSPDTSEPGMIIPQDELDHGPQLGNVIEEESVETGKETGTALDGEKTALSPIHADGTALTNASTVTNCSDAEKSVSSTSSTILLSENSSSAIQNEVETIGVDELEILEGKASQLHGMTSVQENPSYGDVDMFYKYRTSESDPLFHSALHSVGYDEEKKWDANSLSQSSVDPPNCCKDEGSRYNLNRKDSLEMTESDESDHISPRRDADCLTENTGWLLSETDQKDRHNLRQIRQQLSEEVAQSAIDCENIIRTGHNLDIGPSEYDAACERCGEGLYKQTLENNAGHAKCDATRRSFDDGLDAKPIENEMLDNIVEASEHCDGQLQIAHEASYLDHAACERTQGSVDEGLDAEQSESEVHDNSVEASDYCDDLLGIVEEPLNTASASDETRCSFDDGLDATSTRNAVLEDFVEVSELCVVPLRIAEESPNLNPLAACDEATGGVNEGLDAALSVKKVHVEVSEHCDDNLQIAKEALDFVQVCDETRPRLKAGLDATPTTNEVLNDVVEASEQCDDQLRIERDESGICLAAQDTTWRNREEGPHDLQSKHEAVADVVEAAKDCCSQLPLVNEVLDIGPAVCDETRHGLGDGLDATTTENEMLDDVVEASEDCDEQLRIDNNEWHNGLAAQSATRGNGEEGSSESQANKSHDDDATTAADDDDAGAAKDCDDQLRIANENSLIGLALQELASSSFEDRQGAHPIEYEDKTLKFIAKRNGVCEAPLQTAKEGSNVDAVTCYTELDSFDIEQNVPQIENDEPDFIAKAFCCCINTSRGGNEDSDVDVLAYVAERESDFFDTDTSTSGVHLDTDVGGAPCDSEQGNREDGSNAPQPDFTEGSINNLQREADSTLPLALSCEVVVANRCCDEENGFSRFIPEGLDKNEVLIDKSADAHEDDMDTHCVTVNEINVAESSSASVIYDSGKTETVAASIIDTKPSRSEDELHRSPKKGLGRITPSESLEINGDDLLGSNRDSHNVILETISSTGRHTVPIEHLDHITRPPLFPNHRVDLHEDPDKLLCLLSSKLKSQKPAQRGVDSVVMANSADTLFDPNLSVFAGMERDTYGNLEISPPGSPISPSFFIEDDTFSSDGSCSVPSLTALCSMVHPEISHWDLVPSCYTLIKNHPELILTRDLADNSEPFVRDLRHNNIDWTGACALDLSFNEDKKTSPSAPYERTSSATDTCDRVTILSASELVPSVQRAMVTSTSSSCPSSPYFYSSKRILLLSTNAEKKGFPDTNNRVRQTSELRRTVSLSNLQSLKSKPCALHCLSTSDDNDEEELQLGNDSLFSGDEEEKSNIRMVQTLNAVSKSSRRMREELIPSFEKLVSLDACRNGCIRYIVSLHWKQLQALWLHSEACRSSFVNRKSTIDAKISKLDEPSYFNSVVTSRCMTVNSKLHDLQLFSSHKCGGTSDSAACVNDLLRLSSFLSMDQTPERSLLKQKIFLEKGRETQSLLTTASSRLSTFTEIVRSICGHSTVTDDATLNFEKADSGIRHLIAVKTAHAIQSKASFKYDGDILQVKDVLRARIIFPNEGALICGLARLSQVEDARGQSSNNENHQTKVRVVRIKNLFYGSSPVGGLVRSSLPTGYRHILVNVEMNDDFIAEIQFNLSALYDVLGDKGPLLHKDLCNLHATLSSRNRKLTSFDMCTLITCATGITPPCDVSKNPDAGDALKAEVSASMETEKIGTDLLLIADGTEAPRSATMSWKDMDLGGMLSDTSKDDMLDILRKDTMTLCDEEFPLALLECAFACASGKVEDPACSFCLCLVVLYCVRLFPTNEKFKLGDNFDEPAGFLGLARSYLVKSLSVCLDVRLEEQEIDDEIKFGKSAPGLLNLLALTYAEEGRWNDAASVLTTLILLCEERYTKVNPILITAMLDLASMSRRAGNHSHAAQLLTQTTERVSMLLVGTEASYMEYLRNASRDTTSDAPMFYLDDGRDSFEILRQFVIVFQQGHVDLQRFRDPWICSFYHRVLGDSFAVLANCEQATWLHLPTSSTKQSHTETIRYYWSCALSHFEKAFEGFSAVAGIENSDVSGTVFGMVRCLRELGETDKALELLSMIVAGLENVTPAALDSVDSDLNPSRSPCYVAHALHTTKQGQIAGRPRVNHHIMRALCLWWMSILSVDKNKGKDGRDRAFRFLHTSSLSLQLALTEMHPGDEDTRKVCVDFLETIEQEARNISQQR